MDTGRLNTFVKNNIAFLEFSHPKANCLTSALLARLTTAFREFGNDNAIRVCVLQSSGENTFSAGASLEELQMLTSIEQVEKFFLYFSSLIVSMKSCPKPIIGRIQGKAVGGGVGLIAASDYALATLQSSVRLSELAVGIGPFVVGPAIERKIGKGAFGTLTLDTRWRTASWCKNRGLFGDIFDNTNLLDQAVYNLSQELSQIKPEAIAQVKAMLWEGTENWETLLTERALRSARLLIGAR